MNIFDLLTGSVRERKIFTNFYETELWTDFRPVYRKIVKMNFFGNRTGDFYYDTDYKFTRIGLLYDKGIGKKMPALILTFVSVWTCISYALSYSLQRNGDSLFTFLIGAGALILIAMFLKGFKDTNQSFNRAWNTEITTEMAWDVNRYMKEGLSRIDAIRKAYRLFLKHGYIHLVVDESLRQSYLETFNFIAHMYFADEYITNLQGTMSEKELYKVASKLQIDIAKGKFPKLTSSQEAFMIEHKEIFLKNHMKVSSDFFEKNAVVYEDYHYKSRFKKPLLKRMFGSNKTATA